MNFLSTANFGIGFIRTENVMSLFAISDLHLSFGTNKQMDVFYGWQDYADRIRKNWLAVVSDNDTVVLGGDLSWATKLDDSKVDFNYINSLPGQKIIVKGNHDFWWSTVKKMDEFFNINGFDTLKILHNNTFAVGDIAVCGTRGWLFEASEPDKKIIMREAGRLESSISEGEKTGLEPVVFLHYPPVYADERSEEILSVLKDHHIRQCYYGHIHGGGAVRAVTGLYEGINFRLMSCDYNGFCPLLVKKL